MDTASNLTSSHAHPNATGHEEINAGVTVDQNGHAHQSNRLHTSASKTHEVDDQLTCQPGKFDRCTNYTPYFYEHWVAGQYLIDDGIVVEFAVTPEAHRLFPVLQGLSTIRFAIDDYGYIYNLTPPPPSQHQVAA